MFKKPSTEYFIQGDNLGGLTQGASVLLSGVRIGSVSGVELLEPGLAQATLEITEPHKIPAGSSAVLPTSFLTIGDRQVLIVPPSNLGGDMEPGGVLAVRVTSPLESLLPDSQKTIDELNNTLVAFQGLLRRWQKCARWVVDEIQFKTGLGFTIADRV